MTTADQFIAVAARNVGYVESPRGSNRTKFASIAGHTNGYAWCATFLAAVARIAGLTLPSYSAYTPSMAQGFKDAGRWHTTAEVGDFVFFDFIGRISHVGVVYFVGAGYVLTIEGNTDEAGGRTGGQVMRKRRATHIVGYGRPAYTKALFDRAHPGKQIVERIPSKVGPTVDQSSARFHTTAVKVIQSKVLATVDGDWGPRTQAAVLVFQRAHHLTPDAIVGPATWKVLNA